MFFFSKTCNILFFLASLYQKRDLTTEFSDILKGCKRGDPKAQTALYRQYVKAMYNTAFRILQQSDKAEDVVQESFIKAFEMLDSYRAESTFGSWLKRIVVNESLMLLRKEKVSISLDTIPYEAIDDNPQEIWDFQQEEVQILLKCLGNLPEKQRVILNLSLIEGYDNEEICEILNVTDQNCRTMLSRAKKLLRETIIQMKHDRK